MAAAYAALVSLFNDLEAIKNHIRHSFSFDNNHINSLFESVAYLIEFMESYDNCHGPSKDASQLLEMRITIAAQAAEQVLESHVVDQIRGGSTLALGGKKRSPRFLFDLEKVTQDMDYMKRKAMKVQQERSGLELLKQPTTAYSSSRHDPPLSSEKTSMVGFDDLLFQLLDILTGYHPSLRVIPLVGTGGVGKTTLALNAFQHSNIVQHFDVCLWVTISQQYVVQDILSTLLSRKGKSNSIETVGDLGEQLHKRLYGRRYLIVLDDMWSVKAWDEISLFFPDTNNGSRIIVTTRQSNVADYTAGFSSHLSVNLLNEEKSWDLFCEKAFAGEGCPSELEDVGWRIVMKCRGLPLAIVVIAGHLRKSSRMKECWENVANDMMSVLNSEENVQFLNILYFSYSYLHVHLKPCFVYMGTYPEDEEIYVPELFESWIAEGFLKSCKDENPEEIAKDYLKDLIDRNLIISLGMFCKIHDVLRELCLKVAEKEMFFYMVSRAMCRERRVRYRGNNHHLGSTSPLPLVRSLEWGRRDEMSSFDLRLCRIWIGMEKLAYLQHLNLRCLHFRLDERDICGLPIYLFLPSSISLLWNLQTLIIIDRDIIAPNEIWEMIHLRHLYVDGSIQLPDPVPSDKLEKANDGLIMRNLYTLFGVENLKLSEEVCKRLPNIKKLRLQYSGEVRSDYCPHNLVGLRKLEILEIELSKVDSGWRDFFLRLVFPSSLKSLRLQNIGLDWEEMTTMVGLLPHLEQLHLHENSVIGSEWKSVGEGKFLRLKILLVADCHDLVNWNADSSDFPILEKLLLWNVSRLDEFPSDIGTIPTLQSISLWECSVSLAMSALRMVVQQEEDYGNEDEGLKLHFHFWDEELKRFNNKVKEENLSTNNLFIYRNSAAGFETKRIKVGARPRT